MADRDITPPSCPYCHQQMQCFAERKNDNGIVIQRSYMCSCIGSVYYQNEHYGQKE